MDRHVPPRVAYWLSSFDPEMEAVAAEVACLRRAFAGSIAWGVAPRELLSFSWRRGFGIHPRFQLLFRAVTALGQRYFDINHLFGSAGDWFHLRAVQKRPVILTVTSEQTPCTLELLDKVDRFVVEWPAASEHLHEMGISLDRIKLVYPAVDLDRFQVVPPPEGKFTVLFASSPDRAEWLEARGVHLLIDAAELKPKMQFRLIWRPWGDSLPVLQRLLREKNLPNIDLRVGRVAEMSSKYQNAHVTVVPFLNRTACKPAPQSLLESLACGRPVVLTDAVGIGDVVTESGGGLKCRDTAESLAECLERLHCEWNQYSGRARNAAEKWFGSAAFVQSYRGIYEAALQDHRATQWN